MSNGRLVAIVAAPLAAVALVGALHALAAAIVAAPPSGLGTEAARPVAAPVRQPSLPATLLETGLYADARHATLSAGVLPFSPQYPLWTDGASKERFIALPPGSWIDASNPDAWRFPVGTRLWKDFSFGRRVETRYIERGPTGWIFGTYVWNAEQTEATLADARGGDIDAEVRPGVHHTLPSRSDCVACHSDADTPVLGFSLLQLSPDRDPRAPHREPVETGDEDLRTLVARGVLRNLPHSMLARPPRIPARHATERAALGYLHANCGGCHRARGALAPLGMFLAHREGRVGSNALSTTLGVPSSFVHPNAPEAPPLRIVPGRPEASVLVARMTSREPFAQMPPLGTHVVDHDGVQLVSDWIRGLAPSASR